MYLDPGSGSIIVQVLLAGVLGATVIFRMAWKSIKSRFSKDAPEAKAEDK